MGFAGWGCKFRAKLGFRCQADFSGNSPPLPRTDVNELKTIPTKNIYFRSAGLPAFLPLTLYVQAQAS